MIYTTVVCTIQKMIPHNYDLFLSDCLIGTVSGRLGGAHKRSVIGGQGCIYMSCLAPCEPAPAGAEEVGDKGCE